MSNIEINPNKEYILAGDISASMSSVEAKCAGLSRYKYMIEKFQSFIKAAEDFDPHGPTVILFGERVHTYPDTTLEKLMDSKDILDPRFEGYTNLDLAISEAYRLHKEKKREMAAAGKLHPGTVMLVFTDGEPTNRLAVEKILVRIANEIDREEEFQVVFLTVGDITAELKAYLEGLHDDLESKLTKDYDIFHVAELDKTSFLGAVGQNRHE